MLTYLRDGEEENGGKKKKKKKKKKKEIGENREGVVMEVGVEVRKRGTRRVQKRHGGEGKRWWGRRG